MVQTFLVNSNFRLSAKSLDWKRLGKQRVEAYQILNLINDITFLSKVFSYPLCSASSRREWIKEIVQTYKKLPVKLIQLENRKYQICKKGMKGRLVKLGFAYHPIVHAWFGYEEALKCYINEQFFFKGINIIWIGGISDYKYRNFWIGCYEQ